MLDALVGEIDLLIGEEGDLFAVEVESEGIGHQALPADIGETPLTNEVISHGEAHIPSLDGDLGGDAGVIHIGNANATAELHRLPVLTRLSASPPGSVYDPTD